MDLKIGVIVSTTRPSRMGRKITDWFMGQIGEQNGVKFEIIDLQEINLPFLSEEKSPSTGEYVLEPTKQWSKLVNSYDGFIMVTAEYNHGYPAPPKNAIDSAYHEWDKKPVAFVGYGTYGAARAIEQLVSVTARTGMVPLLKTTVGIVKFWEAFQPDGSINKEYVYGDINDLITNLVWWTRILNDVR